MLRPRRLSARSIWVGSAFVLACATGVDPEPRQAGSNGGVGAGASGGSAGDAGSGGTGNVAGVGGLGVGGSAAFGAGGSGSPGGTSGSGGSSGSGSGGTEGSAFGGTGATSGASGAGATVGLGGTGGATGSGGSGGTGPTKPCSAVSPEAGTGVVKIQMKNGGDDVPKNVDIKPVFNIVNLTNAAIPMTELKVRYWYTKEPTATDQVMDCFYAMIDCKNITNTSSAFHAVTPPVSGASHYFELVFTGGTLPASGQSGEIQIRVHTEPYADFSEEDDHSYCQSSAFTDTDHVTVYRKDTLVWGVEP